MEQSEDLVQRSCLERRWVGSRCFGMAVADVVAEKV